MFTVPEQYMKLTKVNLPEIITYILYSAAVILYLYKYKL